MRIAIVVYERMTALDAIGPYEVLRTMPGLASERVRRFATTRMLQGAANPRDLVSVPVVAWREVLMRVRRKQGPPPVIRQGGQPGSLDGIPAQQSERRHS